MTRFSMRLFTLLAVLCWAAAASAQGFVYLAPSLTGTSLTLTCATCTSYLRGPLANDGSANGGSLAFSDPVRNLSTTMFLLESSTAATGSVDTAFKLVSLVDLADADVLLSLRDVDAEKFHVHANGDATFAGEVTAQQYYASGFFGLPANAISLVGMVASSASAVSVHIMAGYDMTHDGSKIATFENAYGASVVAYVSNKGAIRPGNTAVAAAPAQPYACAAGHDGEIIYVRDTDVGAGAKGFLCFCQCDGQASPTCAWAKASDDSTACF